MPLFPYRLLEKTFRAGPGQIANTANIARALGNADRAARVQQVKGVTAFQAVLISR